MSNLSEISRSKPELQAELGRLRRRWFRRVGLTIATLGVLLWFRALWWLPPFQALARQSLQQRNTTSALRWLDVATALVAEDAETAFLRARAYRKQGQMELAAAALQRAHLLGKPAGYLEREQWLAQAQSGQMREAEPHLAKMLTAPGEDGEEICEAFALGYCRAQRLPQALQILNVWLADWPQRAYPYLLRGRLFLLESNLVTAEADFRRACELEPQNRESVIELATVLKNLNRQTEAIPLFERCIDDPHFGSRAQVGLALCLKATGDNVRARSLLERAIKTSPHDVEVLRELGRTALEEGDYATATRWLGDALRIVSYDDETHYLLAQALQASGQLDDAKPHFEYVARARNAYRELNFLKDVLRKQPGDTKSLVRAGALLLEFSDPDEGVVRLLAALDRDPQNQPARQLLADYYDRRALLRPEFRSLAESHRALLSNHEQPAIGTNSTGPTPPTGR